MPLSSLRPETGDPLNVGPDTTKLLADTPVTGSEKTSFRTTVWSDVTKPWAPEYGMVEYSCPTGLHSGNNSNNTNNTNNNNNKNRKIHAMLVIARLHA